MTRKKTYNKKPKIQITKTYLTQKKINHINRKKIYKRKMSKMNSHCHKFSQKDTKAKTKK